MTCCGKDPGIAISHILDKLSCHFACCSGTVIVVYDEEDQHEHKQQQKEDPDGKKCKKKSCRRRIKKSLLRSAICCCFWRCKQVIKRGSKEEYFPSTSEKVVKETAELYPT